LTLPNPSDIARAEADRIVKNRAVALEEGIERVLYNSPAVDRESLLEGLEAFHDERMRRIPSAAKYPESPAWVEHIIAVDREVKKLANLSNLQMAILRSLGNYLCFRGFVAAKPVLVEKCRVAYIPESEVGQIHIKNVDDPATYWKGDKAAPAALPAADSLVDDGTGSGMHIDDEPEEIFPLRPRDMLRHYASDVPGGVQFYKRYQFFFGGLNTVLQDRQKRSVAIEKCSFNFIEVFEPGPDGISHCSGMACRDPNSPQGKYQRAKRDQYLERFSQSEDGPENTFWKACDRAEQMLAKGLKNLGKPAKLEPLFKLFRTPWPQGLNKDGAKMHPDQPVIEYTLITHASLIDQKKYIRWQRDPKTLKMPEKAEEFQF
jgi:hypothetical protein